MTRDEFVLLLAGYASAEAHVSYTASLYHVSGGTGHRDEYRKVCGVAASLREAVLAAFDQAKAEQP